MYFDVIFPQILVLSIIVIVGLLASKAGIITREGNGVISKIIFNITLPLMLLCNFSRLNISSRLLSNSLSIIGLALFILLFMLFVSWGISRLIRLSKSENSIFLTHSVFGNLVYLGFPVISALFGDEGLLYAGMFQLVSNFMIWTVGVMILNQKKDLSVWSNARHILNVNTFAIIIGFTMFLFSVKLPSILLMSLGELGNSTTYLSMLYLGSLIYHSSLKGFIDKKEVIVLTINKLIVIPVLLILLFSVFNIYFPGRIDKVVISTLIVMASMPAMANVVIMAKIFDADDKLAAANVFVSTVICLFTIPLVLLLLNHVL